MGEPLKLSSTALDQVTKASSSPEDGGLVISLPVSEGKKPQTGSTLIDWRSVLDRSEATRDGIDAKLRTTLQNLLAGKETWPLALYGNAGSGKTCAALLALEWSGKTAYYTTLPRFCERVGDAMHGRLETTTGYKLQTEDVWQEWCRVEIAVMDELGTRDKVSDHHYETLKNALDYREGLATIYISNLGRTQLAKDYDRRITSRLSAGTTATLTGDRRLKRDTKPKPTPTEATPEQGRRNELRHMFDDLRRDEAQLRAEWHAADIVASEHTEAEIETAWQAVLKQTKTEHAYHPQVDYLLKHMRSGGWQMFKTSVAKNLDWRRFKVLVTHPDTPKPAMNMIGGI